MAPDRTPTEPKGQRPSNSYLRFGGFALQLLGAVGFAGWLGHRLDLYLSFKFPVFLMTFACGVFAGMLYQANRKFNQE